MRQSQILKLAGVWTAVLATVAHLALLSLHITATFERAVAAPGIIKSLSVNALCGPGRSAALAEDGAGLPEGSGESTTTCPLCTAAAPAFCMNAPQIGIEPAAFGFLMALPFPRTVPSLTPRTHFDGTIRGPPLRA